MRTCVGKVARNIWKTCAITGLRQFKARQEESRGKKIYSASMDGEDPDEKYDDLNLVAVEMGSARYRWGVRRHRNRHVRCMSGDLVLCCAHVGWGGVSFKLIQPTSSCCSGPHRVRTNESDYHCTYGPYPPSNLLPDSLAELMIFSAGETYSVPLQQQTVRCAGTAPSPRRPEGAQSDRHATDASLHNGEQRSKVFSCVFQYGIFCCAVAHSGLEQVYHIS